MPRVWEEVLPLGARSVSLPSAPANPLSVLMTVHGLETTPLTVEGRTVSWDRGLPADVRVVVGSCANSSNRKPRPKCIESSLP